MNDIFPFHYPLIDYSFPKNGNDQPLFQLIEQNDVLHFHK